MTTYSVADAKAGLPRLIDRAPEGEEVVISTYDGLRRRRAGRPSVGVSSVELLDELYEDDGD